MSNDFKILETWWHWPVSLVTWEAEMRGSQFEVSLDKKLV
jgi:hypothetical protein